MAMLKKGAITAPILPKETVTVDELGGEVVVTGLLLKDRFALFVDADSGFARVAQVLAATVIDADGLAIFTQKEWEEFGAVHSAAAINLFSIARKLSGLDSEVTLKK